MTSSNEITLLMLFSMYFAVLL